MPEKKAYPLIISLLTAHSGRVDIIELMGHQILENIATADAAFRATGKTPEELFVSAAQALEEFQVRTENLELRTEKNIKLESKSLDGLLFDFLNELIFLKDAESLVFADYTLMIKEHADKYTLEGTIKGEKIDPKRHELRVDVKAVTKHRFEVKEIEEGYEATVVVDI